MRNKIPIEKLAIVKLDKDSARLVCGVRRIEKGGLASKKFLESLPRSPRNEASASYAVANTNVSNTNQIGSQLNLNCKISIPMISKLIERSNSTTIDSNTLIDKT